MAARTPRPSSRPSRGAAIAECLMAMTVSALILSVIPAFYVTSVKLWQRDTGRLGAVAQANIVLYRMQDEIRNARRTVLSSDGTSVTLVLPTQAYDSSLGRKVNVLNASGSLTDGDQIRYYFALDPHGTGSTGGAVYRRVTYAGGTQAPAQLVADRVYPHLNPRASGGSTPAPVFAYDATLRTITVTITTAEPKPGTGTFAPREGDPQCRRCRAPLVRVPTLEHLEGEVQCSQCGSEVEPTAEVVSYQSKLLLRNL